MVKAARFLPVRALSRAPILSLLVVLGSLLSAPIAVAAVFPITAYQNPQGTFTGEVEVTDSGSNVVQFDIRNTSPVGSTSSIFNVYFEDRDPDLLSNFNMVGGAGTSFAEGGAPPNPPGANNINWGGTLFRAGRTGNAATGVNRTETLTITAVFSGLFSDLQDALLVDQRIAFQIGDCVTPDGSCQAVVTPIPAALPLLLSGIVGLFGLRWIRRRGQFEVTAGSC